jgi:6-phosphofructo-2-kinase
MKVFRLLRSRRSERESAAKAEAAGSMGSAAHAAHAAYAASATPPVGPLVDTSVVLRKDSTDLNSLLRSPSSQGAAGSPSSKEGRELKMIPRKLATLAGTPLCLVMVGLPARGKSYITQKLVRYLRWRGFLCREFNAGNKRREQMGGGGQTADFFKGASTAREQIAKETFDELIKWLKEGGHVAVFDATNTTRARRSKVTQWCRDAGLQAPIFVESICDDPDILDVNYRLKLKNNDYKDMDPKVALADFMKRVREYEAVYEPLAMDGAKDAEEELSYIKLYNVGRKVVLNRCYGFLVSQIVTILQNFHINDRRIFLARHGESVDNVAGRIGGDSKLTDKGKAFAERLAAFVKELRNARRRSLHDPPASEGVARRRAGDPDDSKMMVATSMMRRALETVQPLKAQGDENLHYLHTNQLNEINAGLCEGMTYKEVERDCPDDFRARQANKLTYRYPQGESYIDVVNRLNPVVLDMERLRYDMLVVGHQACIRALMAYFIGTPMEEMPYLDVPLHSVIEIAPGAFKSKFKVHDLSKDAP